MSFFAPLCANDYNSETDPNPPSNAAGGGIIDQQYCHTNTAGTDEWTNLGSNVKFQVVHSRSRRIEKGGEMGPARPPSAGPNRSRPKGL